MNRLAKIWATVGLRLPNLAAVCACRYPRFDPTGVIAEIGGTASRVSGAPEPSSLPLMGIGLLGLSLLLRRKCWLITTGNVRLSGA